MDLKVITSVGTSLITNYNEVYEEHLEDLNELNLEDISGLFIKLKDKSSKEIEENESDINKIKRNLKKWIENVKCENWENEDERDCEVEKSKKFINEKSCAEITSLIKFIQMKKSDLEVHLIASDTLMSCIIAEIIKECLNGFEKDKRKINMKFNKENDCIAGLQIEDSTKFSKEGFPNLLDCCQNIFNNCYGNAYFNITGGYKGVIPLVTIMGQVYGFTVFYTFENTNTIIEMPKMPIQVNENIFEENYDKFKLLEDVIDINDKRLGYEFINNEYVNPCLEFIYDNKDKMVSLNCLGKILWNQYKSKYSIFYVLDDVWNEIEKDKNLLDVMQKKFGKEEWHSQEREQKGKNSEKNGHKVYKQGSPLVRIYFYFDDATKMYYIYKCFVNHDLHENYYTKNTFDEKLKNDIIKKSKLKKIKRVEE